MPIARPYVRSDGTPVRGHSRWAPGARREVTLFAAFGALRRSAPTPSVSYPIDLAALAGER
ncbi:hypothetical protein [Streptomyces caniscabiei]|uniref:Uncharacterized protein n=1 Tax=Streptomyces caniscabiei TaxID=2746961 RepID=A0A927L2K3_9ACTN|nr:hypothetical protein [Streptomyces caniscabiei]MBD9724189.1 hypothetical protein [Streptomyces caniscabiei]MDX3513174.1 hypothetical protein [Streptomyces caniscabiei]MDX3718675.1 hypothetical protein [Streptomyces caniscabiei]MDX3727325.1 hypothetical protein [Streptomyces caniscabiei]WEO21929.1 hypothetical protein IHE65_01570 [Streptomyces caniscabiei]